MSEILSPLISDEQLATELGCTTRTLHSYRTRPDGLTHVKVAGHVMYDPEAVRDWLLKAARHHETFDESGVGDDANRKRRDQGNGGRLGAAQGVRRRGNPLLGVQPKETHTHCRFSQRGENPQSFVIKRRGA